MLRLRSKKIKFLLYTLNQSLAPYDKLAKIFTNCSGHMTKIANIPIYGKNPIKSSFQEPEG